MLATLAIGAGATLAVWKLSPWRLGDWLAGQIRSEWEAGDGPSLDVHAERLAALDGAGWSVLAAGLHSDRIEVRLASERTIESMIRSWRILPPERSAPKAALLARILAEELVRTDADAVGRAAGLAERLLDWPPGGASGLNRIYCCEQVLRAAREQGWPRPDRGEPTPQTAARTVVVEEPGEPAPAVGHIIDTTPSAAESIAEPSRAAQVAERPDPQAVPAELILPGNPLRESPRNPAGTRPGPPLATLSEPGPEFRPDPPLDPDWPRLELPEVIGYLRPGGPVAAATAELRRRGLDDRNLQVARAAADPDAEHRLQLVHALVELPGVNSTGWLLLLARDESPRVRAAAVLILSTSADSRIQRYLDELEETETDSRVRTALQNARQVQR